MDFDEYEYLEKAVENLEPQKAKNENGNGSVDAVKYEERSRTRSSKHKREERADDSDEHHHLSKHSKSKEESSHDHDRHKERGSSHRRSRSRDGEKDRHRSSREHRAKDRDREERNGRERETERVRKERDRESERGRERERERERSRRSRSRSEREPDKSHDREFREREKEREPREQDRESRRHRNKKEDAAEPEVDPERDQRTVFAYQISLKANERDVYEFFTKAGKVRDVRLIMDRNSRRSRGVGYIEFYDVMSVPMAIALSGQPLLGQPVMVKPSEAEKNLVQSTTSVAAGQTGPYAAGGRRLYVGNLHFNITEDQLRQVFESFGSVELVQLPLDETGHSKGFGFVQFARLEDAKNALNLNGQLEIGGQVIKVSTVTDQGALQDVGTTAADLDDDDGAGGLSLNSSSRALLMSKLDRSGTASSITGSAPIIGVAPLLPSLVPPTIQASISTISGLPGGLQLSTNGIPTIDTIGSPSECLLLTNMFDPTLETEPDFELDIKEDVQEECTKFGKLKHIHVDRDSAGFVYLRFEDAQGAINAQRNLHGRWFAGKMITATFMVPQTYEAKFPESNR
ncbi:CC1- LIKE SPLICING FACTOR [Hibiscus trionum]|uniref:CC1- LIKE SPLICING FACTOR n=1 Tax=Hibiscus trionum TaxID=183268 RepID=A0A9W7MM46_HIBTR|nr:CC1- LIKE SPLICING FACTOR [Hibiscus trionum]